MICVISLFLLVNLTKSFSLFEFNKQNVPLCEIGESINGYDYSSEPVKESIAKIRTSNWTRFKDPTSNVSFDYPNNLKLSTANLESSGSIEIYQNGSEPIQIVQIKIERELLETDGWSSVDVFNNQNDIPAQLNNIVASDTGVDYSPCFADVSNEERLLIKTDNALHLFIKNSVHYVHAYVSIPYASLLSLEEATLILNSIHFDGN